MDDLFSPDDLIGLDIVDADECPRCGHDANDHDENGCDKCGCPGPDA